MAGEVAEGRRLEEQPLRQNAARRIDANFSPLPPPALKRSRHLGIQLASQLSARVSLLPNFPLQRFERRAFAVLSDQPSTVSNCAFQLCRRAFLRPHRRLLS